MQHAMIAAVAAALAISVATSSGQNADSVTNNAAAPPAESDFQPPPGFMPPFGGPGGPRGPGGFGPMGMRQETKLVKQFDKDGDKRLNAEERKAAREFLQKQRTEQGAGGPGGRRGGFGPGRFGMNQEPGKPGMKVSREDVKSAGDAAAYDEKVLRTFFMQFENADWEKELGDFVNTDVEVPATVMIDGKEYKDVGAHFRGASSLMMVAEGSKRSINLSFNWKHQKQSFGGYHTYNLLNGHEDASFIRPALYSHIAREYIPAPKANFVRIVINGENWGIYESVQQFNKEFLEENFGATQGARWKVPGSPFGKAGLEYLGEDVEPYKKLYEIKTKDSAESWRPLIRLCKILNETPPEKLEEALAPMLDIDATLKFLALDIALINNDGYWVRASDYSIYMDTKGKFHIIPHDANETFVNAGGPGFGGPGRRPFNRASGTNNTTAGGTNAPTRDEFMPAGAPGGFRPEAGFGPPPWANAMRSGGVEIDPLTGLDEASKPLRSKLLAVPALKARYLGYVREIAEKWLDWNRLGPIARQYHELIAEHVKADTRKLESYEDFEKSLEGEPATQASPGNERRGPGGPKISLKTFADKRRAYLLKVTAAADNEK